MKYTLDLIVKRGSLQSELLERKVRLRIVLPPAYSTSEQHFPVLLMNDGQDYNAMNLENILVHSYESSNFRPFIYVGIEADKNRMQEYGISRSGDYRGRGKKAGLFRRFVTEELIPYLKSDYRLSDQPEDWVYCGMSLGGLMALDIVCNHPELFGRAGVFSGSFWWRNKAYKSGDLQDRSRIILDVISEMKAAPHLKFWFQCGTEDEAADRNKNGIIDAIDDTLDVIKELKAKGYRKESQIRYVEIEGGKHNLQTWARVFPEFLNWAFSKRDHTSVKP